MLSSESSVNASASQGFIFKGLGIVGHYLFVDSISGIIALNILNESTSAFRNKIYYYMYPFNTYNNNAAVQVSSMVMGSILTLGLCVYGVCMFPRGWWLGL